jgi:hypothetical protein
MSLANLVVAALAVAAVIAVVRSPFTTAHVVVLSALPACAGTWILVHEQLAASSTAIWTTLSLVAITAGYAVAHRVISQRLPNSEPGRARRLDAISGGPFVTAIVVVVTIFTTYHFVVGGIPILSPSVEVSRYEFTNSGLYGIPGRMYLFGAPLAAGIAYARAKSLGIPWHADRLTLLALSVFALSRLVSGFKSGLIEVAIVVLVMGVLANGPYVSVRRVLRRHLPILIAAPIALLLVGTLYDSYQVSGEPLLDAIYARSTTGAAEPGVVVFEDRLPSTSGQSSLEVDLQYFAQKYAGFETGADYSFTRLVAATMLGVNPEGTAYTPPVTFGGFAELKYDFGIPIAMLAMLALGALLALLESAAMRRGLAIYMLCLAGVLILYGIVNKGAIMYLLINWLSVATMLLVVGFVAQLASGRGQARGPISAPVGLSPN